MDEQQYITTLLAAFKQNGLGDLLTNESAEKLYLFSNLLVETNKITNLTAITDEEGIILKHFIDCAVCLKHVDLKGKVIDVGTGAGFPGLVLKILKPEIEICLLDSLNKNYISHFQNNVHF